MVKLKTIFICQNCGAESPKWIGKCPACHQWNSYVEEIIANTAKSGAIPFLPSENKPLMLEDISAANFVRINTGIAEFNRVLGGALVPGSLVLIGGEPGIGKSTLVLQLALTLKGQKIIYSSGEESLQQIKLRANRLKLANRETLFLCETSLEAILSVV